MLLDIKKKNNNNNNNDRDSWSIYSMVHDKIITLRGFRAYIILQLNTKIV